MELLENLISTTSTQGMAYCCNQATENKKNQLTDNYATEKFNHNNSENLETILLDLLVNNTDKCTKAVSQLLSVFNYYAQCKSVEMFQQQSNDIETPKVVNIGNKPTKILEKIDYSTLPQVRNVKLQKESFNWIAKKPVGMKRKCDSDDDEADSCFDYKIIESKRLKSIHIETLSSKQQFNNQQEQESSLNSHECMSETYLWHLANKYSDLKEYCKIAVGLGLEENEISIIESKHLARDGLRECFYQCLLTWRLQNPENCTINYFLQMLEQKIDKPKEFIEQLKNRLDCNDLDKNRSILNVYLKQIMFDAEKIVGIKLEESHFWEASGIMAQQWKNIGRSLGISEIDLFSVENKYLSTDGIRECCYQMFLLWSQCYYEKSNLEFLCLGLIEMKLNLFAKQFIELILKL